MAEAPAVEPLAFGGSDEPATGSTADIPASSRTQRTAAVNTSYPKMATYACGWKKKAFKIGL